MRWLVAIVAIVAGCGGSATRGTESVDADPLMLPESTLALETLPGRLMSSWPLPIARSRHAWLVPWSDVDGVHARIVGDDGTRDDRFVDGGTLVGAAALDDGFAIVTATVGTARTPGTARVDFGDAVVKVPLDGRAAGGIATDGQRVLFVAISGGQIAIEQPTPVDVTLVLVARDGAVTLPLGTMPSAPTVWGDASGFIVGGNVLVDGSGATSPAPGWQIRDARVFRKPIPAGTQPTSDSISLGDDQWLALDGLVGWAARDDAGAHLELVAADGRALQDVGDDLTLGAHRSLPATSRGDGHQSWVAGADAAHIVWGATLENDPVFAILDARTLAPASVYRMHGATSRTTVVAPSPRAVLFAWVEGRDTVRYAVATW